MKIYFCHKEINDITNKEVSNRNKIENIALIKFCCMREREREKEREMVRSNSTVFI